MLKHKMEYSRAHSVRLQTYGTEIPVIYVCEFCWTQAERGEELERVREEECSVRTQVEGDSG